MKSRKRVSKKRKVLDKKLLILSTSIVVVVLGLVYYKVSLPIPEIKFSLKAAIIDQLGHEFPNPEFNSSSTIAKLLRSAGFNDISYHKSEDITVNFYRGLANYNCGLIILRAHSALRIDNKTQEILGVDLFTSEPHEESLYHEERRNGLLSKGYYYWAPDRFYFAITPMFIQNLNTYFPKSIVIAMGCWSLKSGIEESKSMAAAFIEKGAKAYVGWTDLVYSEDTDNETVKLLNMLLIEDKPLGLAISETSSYNASYPPGSPPVPTHLDFYPESASNLKVSDLIKEATASITLQSTINGFTPLASLIFITNVIEHKSKDFTI